MLAREEPHVNIYMSHYQTFLHAKGAGILIPHAEYGIINLKNEGG